MLRATVNYADSLKFVSCCGSPSKLVASSGKWVPTFQMTHTAFVFYPEDGGRISLRNDGPKRKEPPLPAKQIIIITRVRSYRRMAP